MFCFGFFFLFNTQCLSHLVLNKYALGVVFLNKIGNSNYRDLLGTSSYNSILGKFNCNLSVFKLTMLCFSSSYFKL